MRDPYTTASILRNAGEISRRHEIVNQTVTDFTDGHDKLNITGYDAIFDFDDIKSHMVQAGDAVMITFSGDHVVLQHVNISQIDSSDFVFG